MGFMTASSASQVDASSSSPISSSSPSSLSSPSSSSRSSSSPSSSRSSSSSADGPWLDASLPRVLPSLLKLPEVQRPVPLLQALEAVKAGARARFNETVEAHVRLRVDPRRGDQMVRGATSLPYSSGKPVVIAVFASGAAAEAARAAGADVIGDEALARDILESKGKSISFDRCVATPDMMPVLVKLGKILGPKKLMPNPKVGTLTNDVAAAVAELRRGRLEFRMDRTGIVHAPVGKAGMTTEQLFANMGALAGALMAAKPQAIKGGFPRYIHSVRLASTMGRSSQLVEVSSLLAAIDAAHAVLGRPER